MDFRLKGPKGQATLRKVPPERPLEEFLQEISDASGVPVPCLSLRVGFPPQPLQLRLGSAADTATGHGDWASTERAGARDRAPEESARGAATLAALGLKTGESIVVQHVEPVAAQGTVLKRSGGIGTGRIIAADNSCLFNAFGYVQEKLRDKANAGHRAPSYRQLVAQRIKEDPERFSEAFLAKPNEEYCSWILKDQSWGGAIELSILAEHFQCEIAAYDICTKRRDLHGEGQGYRTRCMLIYDGIHYDALALAKDPQAPEAEDVTVFPAGGVAEVVDLKARALVEEQHQQRQFTDTGSFSLRCIDCQKGLKGEKETERRT
ncbi:OVARIAN TUMOR DOMAIN-containing deubiquitinating enzyme 2 (OTU domain-containing protein 2) (Deubiquitinating enzyme OTU2) [Durusdinium trenchii]|uniref:Ubiquitin thioesterase OTU n=1 Tax=Durusdinium trenchii TaxID=1381693 RepID=A0ABP0L4L0_9DINO